MLVGLCHWLSDETNLLPMLFGTRYMYLSKLQMYSSKGVASWECICPYSDMYLSRLLNVFVQITNVFVQIANVFVQRRCWLASAAGPQMRLIYFPVLFGTREMSPRFGQRSTNIGEHDGSN